MDGDAINTKSVKKNVKQLNDTNKERHETKIQIGQKTWELEKGLSVMIIYISWGWFLMSYLKLVPYVRFEVCFLCQIWGWFLMSDLVFIEEW